MNADDPRIRYEFVHGQAVYFPSTNAWAEILSERALAGLPVSLPDAIAGWLQQYGQFEVAALGLVRARWSAQWHSLSLLRLNGHYYRVHFENVVCHNCNQRCGPSATPDTVAYAGTNIDSKDIWAEFDRLPLQSCPHCHEVLRHRQTVWLASPDAA
ncbi:hypothetical protein [Caldimonas brevitalea]|uniref:hypothetical protein n=1 Tax=Caldimonas brevitalea TaxID=413882 RepID=UPI0012FC7051|nr:hypothetical protein [Caldimonas brevitalea]